jgi:RNA polymerase sigma-70 factor (ECF subfamily)
MPGNITRRPLAQEMKNMPASDHEWVRQTLEGDPAAFDRLMETYMSRAYRIAFRMVNSREDAEEITQEAFLKAYRALKGFRKESGFFTWFCRILIHLCQDHLRKKRFRMRFQSFFQKENEEAPRKSIETSISDSHWSSNPGTVLEQSEWNESIQEALSGLPVRQRSVFILRHFHDLRIRQIAETLKISEGTVKAHLFRAVQALRRRFGRLQGRESS